MELAEPVGVPRDAPAGGVAMGGTTFRPSLVLLLNVGATVFAWAVAVTGGGAPVALGGRCSIMSRASARLPPMPKGVVNVENKLLAPCAGVATTPQESRSTSLVGQRKRSDSRQLTI